MCTPDTPDYEQEKPVSVEAPSPDKAPQKVLSEDSVDPEKKARKAKKRGTKALRTDLDAPSLSTTPTGSGSGLFIPKG